MIIGHLFDDFGSNFLMHFSFISLVVFSLVVCLFHVIELFDSYTNLYPV
jgi:hypothetical protein